jgi:tRNA-dihydrouridine synthase A
MKSKVSIAPMVDRTDRHFRYFARLLTKTATLYTEMITAPAIIRGDGQHLLEFSKQEKPVVLQIAGSKPEETAEAVKIAETFNYDEINLNAGCPSDHVSEYMMGAALMSDPDLVADIVKAMKKATKKSITVKHRIGIDGTNIIEGDKKIFDSYEDMKHFVFTLADAGVEHFTIHARIAILAGLNPKQNRSVPPIRYEDVYKLKQEFPSLWIEINGGIKTEDDIKKHLEHVDAVMLGRVAYEDPMFLTKIDQFNGGKINLITREEVIKKMITYIKKVEKTENARQILHHLGGLYHGERGSKRWKQLILPPWKSECASEILENALVKMK